MVLETDAYNEVDDQFTLSYTFLSKEKIIMEAVYAVPFKNSLAPEPGEGMEISYQGILKIFKMLNFSTTNLAYRGSSDYLRDIK